MSRSQEDRATLQAAQAIKSRERSFTGVSELLTAQHFDHLMGEGMHEHTWTVTVFYPGKPLRDGRSLKASLRNLLDHLPNPLPESMWSGEGLAEHVAKLLAGCIGARVTRPEGFEAWAWL